MSSTSMTTSLGNPVVQNLKIKKEKKRFKSKFKTNIMMGFGKEEE